MKIGFIGCGNMANAMITGIIKTNIIKASNIFVTDLKQENVTKTCVEKGVLSKSNNTELAKECDVIILAVKPYNYLDVIAEIKDYITFDKIIVSITPGISLETMLGHFEKDTKIVRTMPNTPAMVLEGMTTFTPNEFLTTEEIKTIEQVLNSFGKSEMIEERLMDSTVALCGSSPAYIFILIEAMADQAVSEGINRELAYKLASQAVLGSAKLVLESKIHPGELKDMVCSPSGATIEAVKTLEEKGFRSAIICAMESCSNKLKK